MLNLNNISVQFGGRYLFDNVSFAVGPNQRIGLIGRNGSGKTTLLRIIIGMQLPDTGNVSKPKDYTVGYLPQEIEVNSKKTIFDEVKTSLKELTRLTRSVEELTTQVSDRTDYENPEYLKLTERLARDTDRIAMLGGHSIDALIEKTLTGLGFKSDEMQKTVDTFSGGWQMRVELAKVLMQRPDVILLDEPTNHLDIESIVWVENFLKNYEGAVILVSHDRRFLDNITNRTIEIINGRIYDMHLPYSKFQEFREEQKEQQLNAYRNQQREIAQQERFIERFRAKANLATRVQSKIKQLEKIDRIELDEDEIKAMNLTFPEAGRPGRTIIEAEGLSKSYGDKLVLKDINFAVERGDRIAFVGKNGEGKSTLSKILAGIEEYDGTLKIGHNMQIKYFAQHQANELPPEKTVFQTVDDAATGDMRKQVRNILGAFLFSGTDQDKKVKVLSGGEKSRLALAKLILEPANLLILDEPTNHLDMLSKGVLKRALESFGGATLVVSHDRDFLHGLTSKTVEFKNKGLKTYEGGIDYFLEKLQTENLDALNAGSKSSDNRGSNENAPSQNQLERQQRKETQRELNKIRKIIDALEKEIEDSETRIAEIEELFENPDFFASPDAEKIQKEYELLKTKLEEIMSKWEDAEEKKANMLE